MDWIEGAENLQLRCFDRCALISASHTNSDIFETAICFLLIRACGRGPKPLWRTSEDTVLDQLPAILNRSRCGVPSWQGWRVQFLAEYSRKSSALCFIAWCIFACLHSAWCLFDGGPFRASSLYHGSYSFDTVYIFGFDLPPSTFRLIDLFTAFSTFDMDQ